MARRAQRAYRPSFLFDLESRVVLSHVPLAAGLARSRVSGPIVAAPVVPRLSPGTYRLVLSQINAAFDVYRAGSVASAAGNAVSSLLDAINTATSPDSFPDNGSSSTTSDKGDTALLMRSLFQAISRLPYGGQLWTALPIDPTSITTTSVPYVRDQVVSQVRCFVRQNIQQGSIVWQPQEARARVYEQSASSIVPAGHTRLGLLPGPPRYETPFGRLPGR